MPPPSGTVIQNCNDIPDDHHVAPLYQALWRNGESGLKSLRRTWDIEVPVRFENDVPTKFNYSRFQYFDLTGFDCGFAKDCMLIRNEYRDVMNMFEDEGNVSEVVTGQTGTGKECFLIYALILRLSKGLPTILAQRPMSWYLFHSLGVYSFSPGALEDLGCYLQRIHKLDHPVDLKSEPGWILYLATGPQHIVRLFAESWKASWKVVAVCDPDESIYQAFMKEWRAQICVMEPWSWHEIVAAYDLQRYPFGKYPSLASLYRYYQRYGPSPQVVYHLAWIHNYNEVICNHVKVCHDLKSLFLATHKAWGTAPDDALTVKRPLVRNGVVNRRRMMSVIATRYIAETIVNEANEQLKKSFRQSFTDRFRRDAPGSDIYDVERLFQVSSDHFLRRGAHNITIRSLNSAILSTVNVPLRVSRQVVINDIHEVAAIPDLQIMFHPSSQLDLDFIHSLLFVENTLFIVHCTISDRAPICVREIEALAQVTAARTARAWSVLFVVPEHVGKDFRRQDFMSGVSEEDGKWESLVGQYVLGLEAEDLWPATE